MKLKIFKINVQSIMNEIVFFFLNLYQLYRLIINLNIQTNCLHNKDVNPRKILFNIIINGTFEQ